MATDTEVTIQIQTPGGLTLTIDPDYCTVDIVRDQLREGLDEEAAKLMANLTFLPCTIRRVTQTTMEVTP